jgi:hypothetical protein
MRPVHDKWISLFNFLLSGVQGSLVEGGGYDRRRKTKENQGFRRQTDAGIFK